MEAYIELREHAAGPAVGARVPEELSSFVAFAWTESEREGNARPQVKGARESRRMGYCLTCAEERGSGSKVGFCYCR